LIAGARQPALGQEGGRAVEVVGIAVAGEVVDADRGTSGYEHAVDSFAWGRHDARQGSGHWRVESRRFGQDGVQVFKVGGTAQGDFIFGGIARADLMEETVQRGRG